MWATETIREVSCSLKWLVCIQIQPLGNEVPQSFSMYPLPPVNSTCLPSIVRIPFSSWFKLTTP